MEAMKKWKRRKRKKYTHIDILHNKTNILKLC